MGRHKFLFLASSIVLLSSCSLSKTFHKPYKNKYSLHQWKYVVVDKDTSYIHYNQENKEINFTTSNGTIINDDFIIKDTFFVSSSGNRLNGWFLTPKNLEPIATILHFHGSANNLFLHYRTISPLIDYGFQVFTFDYSGYGFSAGKATRQHVLDDAYSALDFLQENERIKENIIIYGHSYGGYLASIVGSNKQNDIKGIVIEGAFSAHKAEANYTVPILGLLVKNEELAAREIRKNSKPVLIIHSTDDKKVPLKFGKEIFNNANQPKVFYQIDKPHIMGLQYYDKEIAEKIKMMLDQ